MPQITTISYIHFPRKARAITNYKSIHAFNPETRTMWSINWFNNLFIKTSLMKFQRLEANWINFHWAMPMKEYGVESLKLELNPC